MLCSLLFVFGSNCSDEPSCLQASAGPLSDDAAAAAAVEGGGIPAKGKGLKAMLNTLEELWDESQYSEEYDLSNFLTKLKK